MAGAELKHVLDGYKVLDCAQVLAGSTVTRLMAEMGAEIIKVELAPTGDLSRSSPFLKDGRSAYFIQQNRGKKSLCIDAKNSKGLEILKSLVAKVDVLVENYTLGGDRAPGAGLRNGQADQSPSGDVFSVGLWPDLRRTHGFQLLSNRRKVPPGSPFLARGEPPRRSA